MKLRRLLIIIAMLLAVSLCCVAQQQARAATGNDITTFTVAAIQAVSKLGEPAANRKHLEKMIRRAAKNNAKVVVLPETAVTGYMSSDLRTTWQLGKREITPGLTGRNPDKVAETVPGESTEEFGKLAKELEIYLTVPLLEIDPNSGRYYNSVVLMGPGGKVLLHYRKLNPWPYAEKGWASKGDRGNVFIDTPYGRMSLLICFDINFEPKNLKKLDVDHLLYPIAWVDSRDSDWFEKRLPEIARDNNLNIIGANWTVPENSKPDWHGYGHSLIINRRGKTLAKVTGNLKEEIIYADMDIVKKQTR
jgi:predicted amidohydrolase